MHLKNNLNVCALCIFACLMLIALYKLLWNLSQGTFQMIKNMVYIAENVIVIIYSPSCHAPNDAS